MLRLRLTRMVCAALAATAAAPAASALALAPTTTRASVSSTGAQANGNSYDATVSSDGRFVAFASNATKLVPGDTNGFRDVFLRDRLTGETRRLNVGPQGQQANGSSYVPALSADGSTVAFVSLATNLDAGGAGAGLFLVDRASGSLRRLALDEAYSGASLVAPSLSASGGQVAFVETAPGRTEVMVADTATGAVRRVSEAPNGTPANGTQSFDANISGDGRWVAFTTDATNLATPDINGYRDVVARDLMSGAFTRLSVGAGNAEANLHSSTPALSRDGCTAAFFSSASNLVAADGGLQPKVFVRDRCGANTEVASVSNGGANGTANAPIDLSDDGCVAVFPATTIVSPPPTSGSAAVLRDRCAGVTSRLDLSSAGDPGAGNVGQVSISGGNGRYVAFTSSSAGLVAGDTNASNDIFVRDRGINAAPLARLALSQAGSRVVADASGSSDPDGPTVTGSFAFGDGSPPQAGLTAVHDYARGGTYGVTVTVTDADGATASQTAAVTVPDPGATPAPTVPPGLPGASIVPPGGGPGGSPPPGVAARLRLDAARLSSSRWAVVPRGRKAGGTRGARLSLRLTAAATVTLRFERVLKGRRVSGRCANTRRRGKRCTRYVAAGSLVRSVKAGASSVALSGRIGRRALAPGRYRLRVSAANAGGRAPSRTLTFTIVKPRRP